MSISILDAGSRISNVTLNRKNNRIYISEIGQNENYESLEKFPKVIQAINDINKIISKIEIQKAIVFEHLRNIDNILLNSPSPHPDDLAIKLLPNILRLLNGSNDEDAKTICLKIMLYTSLSTNEKITDLYDDDMIQLIIDFVSVKKPFLSKTYIQNLIYSCGILNNILICSKECQRIYDIYMNNKLLKYLNDKLLSLSSNPEIQFIFSLIICILKFSDDHQKGVTQFKFIIPTLINLISYSGIPQEKSLECLYIFLQDYECLQECISNNLQEKIFDVIINDNFNYDNCKLFKCLNSLCSDDIMPPLSGNVFFEKLIDCIISAGSDSVHEIFLFFLKAFQFDPKLDQNGLIQKILDVVEFKDFSYKTECINFFILLILDSILNVSEELENSVAFYLLYTAYQFHEDCLSGCLHVIDILLAKSNQLSENILADPDFFDFLKECSTNQLLDKECCEISMMLLQKYDSF